MFIPHRAVLDAITKYFPPSRLAYRPASDSWDFEGRGITVGELMRIIAFETDLPGAKVQNTLTAIAWQRREQTLALLKAWVRFSDERAGHDDAELRAWLRLMQRAGTSEVAHEAHVVAMKQWIWQVKRAVLEQGVVWHVAPIFWSTENGTGKSYNLRRLISPIAAFTRNLDVDELGEKFSGRMFAQTLVAFLDEFAGAEHANVGQLKAILTGKPIDARSMFSESGFYAENRMSCIASSNVPPPHNFVDTTGARRFWSIHCSSAVMLDGDERMTAFDAIDIDAVWASVASHAKSPQYTAEGCVLDYMDRQREESLRSKTSLESFCEECLEADAGERIPLKEFQERYRQYCASSRQLAIRGGYKALSDLLTTQGYDCVNLSNRRYLRGQSFVDFERLND